MRDFVEVFELKFINTFSNKFQKSTFSVLILLNDCNLCQIKALNYYVFITN